jgi:transposase-like protein
MTKKMPRASRARYTLEFKKEAVRLVEGGQTIGPAGGGLELR